LGFLAQTEDQVTPAAAEANSKAPLNSHQVKGQFSVTFFIIVLQMEFAGAYSAAKFLTVFMKLYARACSFYYVGSLRVTAVQ
jgi:hypothetical protein